MNLKLTLSLLRLPNLFIIGLTQYFCRHLILRPILKLNNLDFLISELDFSLLVFATILIAAGGYLINDYFDLENDLENQKTNKASFVLKHKKKILWAHHILSAIGIILGFFLAYKVGKLNLGFTFFLVATLLWFYSLSYKKKILTGNFVIAFLSALTILIVWLFVFYAFKSSSVQLKFSSWFLQLIGGYTIFAFLISLIREIIKDMEDIKGDKAMGMSTFPIIFGIRKTKIFVLSIIILTILLFIKAEIWMFQLQLNNLFYYFAFGMNSVFLLLIVIFTLSKTKKDFWKAQQLTKIIMLAGILSMLFIPAYAEKFL